jgi:S1-C subfamily serine protease
MPFKVLCTGCNKRFLIDDQAVASKAPCPSCKKSLAEAQRLPDGPAAPAAPAAWTAPVSNSIWDELPPATRLPNQPRLATTSSGGASSSGGGTFPWKIVAAAGGLVAVLAAIGLSLMFRAGEQIEASDKEQDKLVRETVEQARASEEVAAQAIAALGARTKTAAAAEIPAAPVASASKPAAETQEEKPRVKMAVADLIEAIDDGVVHITVHDADGDAFATGSGFIIERRKVDSWVEPVVKTEQPPMKGDLWLVATNHHVVAGASSVTVRMRDGKTFKPRGLAAHDAKRDLAILALDQAPDSLTILKRAPDAAFRQGEEVVAIGHPKGFDFTVSTGIISAIRGSKELPQEIAESIEAPDDQQWIQTTAAITNGNSGGPLLTMYGEVIGINTWVMNSDGNLAFASHVKHMAEMHGKCIETKDKLLTIKTEAFSVAKAAETKEKLGDRNDWLDTEVREELTRSVARATAIDWRPATKGDYLPLEATAMMTTIAAVYRFDVDEPKKIADAFRKRTWNFATDVEPINRYAVENLKNKEWGSFFFGKVKRINPGSRRHLWVDLTGRGVMVAVTIPSNQPAPKLEVGDEIAVFGVRVGHAPENSRLPRDVDHLIAGLIVPVKLPPAPEVTSLRVAYDLVKHDREDQGFEESVRKFNDTYERVLPLVGKTAVRFQRLELNTEGQQFAAVRFTVPAELPCDLAWAFTSREDCIEHHGVLPVGNFPMWHKLKGFEARNVPIAGLSKEETQHVFLQGIGGGLLVPGQDYLLWFTFRDPQPHKLGARRAVAADR